MAEVAVVGLAAAQWCETPAAFVVCKPDRAIKPEELLHWPNQRLRKTQRLAKLHCLDELHFSQQD